MSPDTGNPNRIGRRSLAVSDNIHTGGEVPLIYGLFPSLVGEVDRWLPHVERAADMGFNWLFLNPLHLTGASGSLYSIREYFQFSPLFFPQPDFESQKSRLREFVNDCRELGVEVMVDLVINHTAYDNSLTREHRDWYKTGDDGTIKNPGAVDNTAPGGYVVWGDLSEIDNENSSDKQNLHEYWWKLVEMFLDVGVRGFRCDAAYQIPTGLWKMLIERSKSKVPGATFFAESLGCSTEETLALVDAGHDFVFNSGKWWDYRESWFLSQLAALKGKGRSICFPESHDTQRLAEEWNEDVDRIKQRYLFTALISSGIMIQLGFEYGFRKKPHVVHTNPLDYEGARYDLTEFIRQVNALKSNSSCFHEDNQVEKVDMGDNNVLCLRKTSIDGRKSALVFLNLGEKIVRVPVADTVKRLRGEAPVNPKDGKMVRDLELKRYGCAIIELKSQG